ncbi:hypothetical protein [Flavobacterium sp. LM4]|uniref:hypothetical protein n=1 Tax=Flavobacterium sp. LM4 TaxID=1938609 RepID=UPI000F50D8CA|nr:hypothetical protein [Flavobacterium sp. LM4]
MKNLFLFIVHFATMVCFSQNVKIDSIKQFTTNEIDSICKKNGRDIISEGRISTSIESKIKRNQTKILNGSGGFSYKLYVNHFNKENYDKLSKIEKRKYDFDKYSDLIKGDYHQAIHYENSYSENIYGEFYYFKTSLFYVKIKVIRTENNKEDISETFNLSLSELNDAKVLKNIFLMDLKGFVNEKNNELIKIYNRK